MRSMNASEQIRWISARRLCAVAVGFAICTMISPVYAQRLDRKPGKQKVKRAAPETAIGGVNHQQRDAQQFNLSGELIRMLPQDATNNPVKISLTVKDRADLAAPKENGKPLQIGLVKKFQPIINVQHGNFERGVVENAADGSFVWAVTVTSPEAQAIRVHFENFSLPAGAEMYFMNLDGEVDGPYVGKGRNENGGFWTRSISSNTGVIQLRYKGRANDALRAQITFSVTALAHIHKRNNPQIGQGSVASHDTWPCSNNASCLVDANCSSSTPADPAKDAVAKMEWISGPSVFTCSGGLLVDTVAASQIPYFLTANHCTSTSIANMETWFNYTTDSCNGVCPHNILTGGAPPSDTVGFTVLASSASSDFTLGTLNQTPPAGVVFLGWNNSAVAFTNGSQLHRISNANFGPQVYSQQNVDTGSPVCGGLARGNFIYSDTNTGGTMGGSSGSPVVNTAGEVVGQLFGCCGFNCALECESAPTNWTVDGAFAVTWPSVAEFLDPPSSGCTSDPECDDGLFCNGAETCDIPSGNCQSGTAPNCNDGVSCTDDSCNEGTNQCDNIVNNSNCDDGLYCNGTETCSATLDCRSGRAPDCDDGVGCTSDSCNEGTDSCDNIPSNGLCDDGQFCNGAETCDPILDCQAGTAPNCNDGVSCTDDSCNEGTDQCDNITNNANCDDGQFCNGAETCHATLDCQTGSDPCPGQVCLEATDECVDCTGDPDCDDGAFCNGAETCVGGTCQSGSAVNCNDGVGCTDDSCNEGTDQCNNIANNANCDNGLFCDGSETCDSLLDCQAGTTVNCDDGVSCTDDSCNEGTDSCDNIANNANCPDDGLFCNGTEFCDAIADCSSTGDPCGGAGCDEGSDTCTGPVAQLEAGTVTAGGSNVTVNLANTYISPVVVCTIQRVNNTIPVVTRVTNVTSTSFEVYIQNPSGSAVASETVNWVVVEEGSWTIDGINIDAQTYLSTITDDASANWFGESQAYGQAFTEPVVLGQVMSDNDSAWSVFWNMSTTRTAPPSAAVLTTGKTVCEDSVIARNNETVGFIVFEAGHGTLGGVEFEAGLGADTVLGVDNAPSYSYTFFTPFAAAPQVRIATQAAMDGNNGGWAHIAGSTGATSTQLLLIIDEDQIQDSERSHTSEQVGYAVFASAVVYPSGPECTTDPECDDGIFCNGVETCVAQSCQSGAAVNCNDGVGCTDDSCNEGSDSCDNIANNGNCDDGAFCNGAETCDAVLDCQAGSAPNCNDGVGCTDDSCNEGTDSCDNVANNANCDDGLFCNGAETCHATLDCQSGTTVNCDDGVGCTDDSCNEGTDSCDNVANNGNCPDDGLFCNGSEFCDAVADCSSTGDPCSGGEICNEGTDTCDPGSAAKLETGTLKVGSGSVTVNLTNTYASPVVVCSVNFANNTVPVVTRVSAVTSSSFDVRLQNAGAGIVDTETVHYIVVEEGTWTIDGVNIEAQLYNSTVTDENNSWVGEAQSYNQTYTTPVILGQVMSENDADWSVFWDQGTSRTTPPSASSLRTGKTVCEDFNTTRANETIGFIVIEAGSGTINGVAYEAALGADIVLGVTNAPPYTYTFGSSFGSTPQVAIVTMAAVDGGNGGWAYLYGASALSATSMDLAIEEDTIGDTERNHISEQVFYLVFESAVTVP